jgi:hypothetical protein
LGGVSIIRIIIGIIIILHGLIHLLYFGQSARFFELQSGMVWPSGSWAFLKILGDGTTRILANISLVLAAIGFAVGGLALLFQQAWFQPVVAGAAILSILIYILFWNGKFLNLDNQGGVGILIDLAILVSMFTLLKSFLKI